MEKVMLSERLYRARIDSPDEWIMKDFKHMAEKLEAENRRLREVLEKIIKMGKISSFTYRTQDKMML